MNVKPGVWKGLLKYGLGLGLLAWVVHANWDPPTGHGLSEVVRRPVEFAGVRLLTPDAGGGEELPPTQLLPFLAAVVVCAAALSLTFVRWYLLVRAQDLPFTLRNATRLGLVGYFYNNFLPGSVGGDLLKAYSIAKEQQRRTVAVATVLIDRAVGLAALFWLAALVGGVFWLAGDPMFVKENGGRFLRGLLLIAWGVVAVTALGWVALTFLPDRRAERFAGRLTRLPWAGGPLSEFWRAVWLYHKQPWALGTALLLSVVGHAGFVLVFYLAALTLADPRGALPTLAEHYLIIPVGMTFQAFFPTPGGVGGGEVGFGLLYSRVGASGVGGVLGSLGNRLITWVIASAGYVVFLQMRAAHATPDTAEPEPGTPEVALAEAK